MFVGKLESLRSELLRSIENASSLETLENIRVYSLGRQGKLTFLLKNLINLPSKQRKIQGKFINILYRDINKVLKKKIDSLNKYFLKRELLKESIDVTLPVYNSNVEGFIHPLSQTMYDMISSLVSLGFQVVEGPDIENDFYNFTALNFPLEHPARQEQDTFYIKNKDKTGNRYLMRTHTSPVQIRTMLENKPPIAIIVPGRVFRSDSDQTHTPVFHQIEGLLIDKDINMGHLKGVILDFCNNFFELSGLKFRFRPSYFPFTEPSAELDIGCDRSSKQLKLGGMKNWLEVLGCGMVHPNVLKNCGINSKEYQGFAFGMGVERFSMLKYEIADLRSFYESNLHWLRHYGFCVTKAFSLKCL